MAVGGLVLVGWLFEARALLDSIDISTLTGLREAGRMPFMPAVRLNQRSGALPKPASAFQLRFFSTNAFAVAKLSLPREPRPLPPWRLGI
jgi:hypothetical protein